MPSAPPAATRSADALPKSRSTAPAPNSPASSSTARRLQRLQFNQNTSSQVGGLLTFTSLAALPGGVDPVRGYRQTLAAAFAQDDLRVRRNLTVNLGLRYETVTVPSEVNGKISNLRQPTDREITVGVRQSVGEGLRSPDRARLGPVFGRKNVNSGRIWRLFLTKPSSRQLRPPPGGVTAFTGAAANGTPTVAANWGVITSAVDPSRQAQLALKAAF